MAHEVGVEDAPHPRERHDLVGQGPAAAAFVEAIAAGRLHHAWLVGGPKGVGKATLAYRVARRLVAPPAERVSGGDGLGVDPAGRAARQVAAGSHPNVFTLERAEADGTKAAPKTIPIEAVRRALAFFGQTAADGGKRVCIVDSVEDLTLPGVNALLKTVEEPPLGSLILLISHAPQRVLPTIRSRCRKLQLGVLDGAEIEAVIGSLGPDFSSTPAQTLSKAAAASEGSVARALTLLDPKRLALLDDVGDLLRRLPDLQPGRVLALADRLGDKRGEADSALALDAVLRWLGERVEHAQALGPARLAPLAEACEKIVEASRAVDIYNLDRRPFVVSMFEDLAAAVRRAA